MEIRHPAHNRKAYPAVWFHWWNPRAALLVIVERGSISKPSFRGDANGSGLWPALMTGSASNYDVQLHIGEYRDSPMRNCAS